MAFFWVVYEPWEMRTSPEVSQEAIIGGEGNGGVILPDIHMGRDAPLAVAFTLQSLLEYKGTVAHLVQTLPKYHMVKEKINIEDKNPDQIIKKLIDKFSGSNVNLLDGVKIDEEDYWVHLRKSNTEPIIRIIAEAKSRKKVKSKVSNLQKHRE